MATVSTMPPTSVMPSMAVYSPLTKPPTEAYLSEIRTFMLSNKHLRVLAEEIQALESTWKAIAGHQYTTSTLIQGPRHIKALSNWIKYGDLTALGEASSGIIALPFLIIIQTTQYIQYLHYYHLSHVEFLDGLRQSGGMQGYCAGLLAAFAIACSKDESEVIQNAATALRIGLMIGAYQEAGDRDTISGATTMVLRLSHPGQGDEIVGQFPGCYISAVTDPKTVSIVGPTETLKQLSDFAHIKGLLTQEMGLRGKVHNPENMALAMELCQLCDQVPSLQLPDVSRLQVAIHSNRTGRRLDTLSLTHEVVYTILTARCEWYTLLEEVAQDLKRTGVKAHVIACFGLGDCVPLAAFHQANLSISKIDVSRAVKQAEIGGYEFNEDAIAIVGTSCRFPGANNLDEIWELLSNVTSKCEPVRQDRVPLELAYRALKPKQFTPTRKYYGNFVDDIDKFDHSFFRVGFKEASYMDPQQRILLELAYEAINSSGYLRTRRDEPNVNNVGCFIGASMVEYLENTSSHPPTAFTSMGTIRAFLCGRLSYYFGWNGPAEVIDTACSSSLVAVHRACKAILGGECPMALAGGISLITGVANYLDLGKAGFLSPTGQCKPFDALADGYCRADGGALVLLKKLSDAEKAGDQILGVITGTATNQGGLSTSITVPYQPAQVELFRRVLNQSNMTADYVTYVEAHGTGTQAGDPVEIAGIRQVLGGASRLAPLQIGSIKGNIGHCESAAGVAGLLKLLSMLKFGKIPPVANFKSLNPKIPPLAVDKMAIAQSTETWIAPLRAACINSYGAAGSNATLLCCEYRGKRNSRNSQTPQSQSFPILVSAHSKESLLLYMKHLALVLTKETRKSYLGNLAFTLSERREHHQFRWMTTGRDIPTLYGELADSSVVTHVSPNKLPVVLAFGGQTKQIVGFERLIYETCPRLKHYVDTCEKILIELGFPPIVPAMFQTTPITDVVVLQTATFVSQYSCARCWIDSGLDIHVVIGHSFGELTALVIAGVWTLRDGLKVIATRAKLISTEWGVERGAMLAINAPRNIAQDICRLVNGCEIACFNSEMSQVIVGSATAIDLAMNILRSKSEYQGIHYQRLNVSHGFHSKLTEPLLNELSSLTETIATSEARILFESCTAKKCDQIEPDHVVRHIREPVYFEDAVHRIEDSFGQCIWLEAGMNSPIVPMVKKALRNSNLHKFQQLSFHGRVAKEDVLAKATLDLWLEGIEISFWPFLTPKDVGLDQIYLPQYSFLRNTAWVENIDHATQLHLAKGGNREIIQASELPLEPVRLVVGPEVSAEEMLFIVNTESTRFKAIVSSHAVRGRPLCPASLYMECVTMAIQLSNIELSIGTLCFEGLSFEHPLGIHPNRRVTLKLCKDAVETSWKFSFESSMGDNEKPRIARHAAGILALRVDLNVGAYHRTIPILIKQLLSTTNHEKLLTIRAYGLFSRVVTYAALLRGIKSVVLSDCQALAEVQLPNGQVCAEESTAVGVCDAIMLDIFLQVAGLLINSGEECQSDSVFVATGIDNVTLSNTSSLNLNTWWRVYANHACMDASHATGDIFVFEPDNTLVLTVTGVSFTKLHIGTLEKILDGANPATIEATNSIVPSDNLQYNLLDTSAVTRSSPSTIPITSQQSIVSAPTLVTASSATEPSGTSSPMDPGLETSAKNIISSFTGAPVGSIRKDTTIDELGLDSLAAVEMAEELTILFGKEISSMQLLESSSQGLLSLVESMGKAPKGTPGENQPLCRREAAHSYLTPSPHSLPSSPLSNKTHPHDQLDRLKQIIAEVCGIDDSALRNHNVTLRELVMDPLVIIELKRNLEDIYDIRIANEDLLDSSLNQISRIVVSTISPLSVDNSLVAQSTQLPRTTTTYLSEGQHALDMDLADLAGIGNPFTALLLAEADLPMKAQQCGMSPYWDEAMRRLDGLTVAYILEALKQLGCNLHELKSGEQIPFISHLPVYQKATERYYHILQKHGLIEFDGSVYIRTALGCSPVPAMEQLFSFKKDFPRYRPDVDIIAITGPKLADCLTGRESPISLLFGSAESRRALEGFYTNSPALATSTELMVDLISRTVGEKQGDTVQIMEVGGGFCGTTKRLTQELEAQGHKFDYTLTDISPSLVAQASKTMSPYRQMKFETFNVENEPKESLRGKFDIVISTNCVHATTDRVASLRHIRQLLNPKGFAVLSEGTRIMDWYDIVFGLLDGWWRSGDGSYPLQTADSWVQSFKAAGFEAIGHSQLPLRRLNTQSLILGSMEPLSVPFRTSVPTSMSVETLVYKEVQGVEILADIYIPKDVSRTTMGLAMMIHGGGHMTLSRKAVRPAQTSFLLDNGVLPVSFDYRLCPQVNLIDGPIADIRDAYQWMRMELPTILERHGIAVDPTRVAVIGWSTGGHLAMTTDWTSKSLGIDPPRSILSFYGPTDFESGELDAPRLRHYHDSGTDLAMTIKSLPKTPVTSYGDDETSEWLVKDNSTDYRAIRAIDPRFKLVLSLFKRGHGLSLLLNNPPEANEDNDNGEYLRTPPAPERVAEISPMAHVRGGKYTTPTFLVHGTEDEIVPFSTAVNFVRTAREQSIDCGLLTIPGAKHLHDLHLVPGTAIWEAQVAAGYEFLLRSLQ